MFFFFFKWGWSPRPASLCVSISTPDLGLYRLVQLQFSSHVPPTLNLAWSDLYFNHFQRCPFHEPQIFILCIHKSVGLNISLVYWMNNQLNTRRISFHFFLWTSGFSTEKHSGLWNICKDILLSQFLNLRYFKFRLVKNQQFKGIR